MTRELDEAWFRKNSDRAFRTRWPTQDEIGGCGVQPNANGPLMTIVRGADLDCVTCSLPAPSRDNDRYLRFLFDLTAVRKTPAAAQSHG
jgi:hypothetical protein